MRDLKKIKELTFETDNNACFIERERILGRIEKEMEGYTKADRFARIFSALLAEVSTPILDCDYFAGRVVEALPDAQMQSPSSLLCATGHMSFDYETVLKAGLRGILSNIFENAEKKGDEESYAFAKNAEIVVNAIHAFSDRYAQAAESKGFHEMAKALRTVPFEPAYDFYSALQGIWLLHLIASCYVGARDYAFGRFDKYMLPFYEKAIREGKTEEELTELLAGFFIKTNEICGRCTHNFNTKPIPCPASKQYVNIGGETPNAFSNVVLAAAKLSDMPQPQIVVLMKPDADASFTKNTFEALSVLTDKMNIYNYDLVVKALKQKGIDEETAKDFTYSACCTFDLHYHAYRRERYLPVPAIFNGVLESKTYSSIDEILAEFEIRLREEMQNYVDVTEKGFPTDRARKMFVLDSLLLTDSARRCRYACDGKADHMVLNIFCPGIATVGDSLLVLDTLVFKEKRYTYNEFMDIVKNNFENQEDLRQEILRHTKFGNDTEADLYTVLAGKTFLSAADKVKLKENYMIAAGFYSLDRENVWGPELGATPDGRKAGQPFSENQSPTYGADKNGITALLKSISKLPLDKTVSGGLNLTFSQKISPEILQALVLSYFNLGGLHVGISVIDRNALLDAMENPDKYKSLTVRLYGFSEYFVSLPRWQQIAVLNRTEYK